MESFKKALIILALVLILSLPTVAKAANLYFSPSSGTYNAGQTFPVAIFVSSTGQAVNGYSAQISFPVDKLQVISIATAGSVVNFWAQEPSFSNATGRVSFEGVTLAQGFQGQAGRIITINFRGRAGGIAKLSFISISSSVLAADGQGTDVLQPPSGAQFSIAEAVAPLPAPTPTSTPAVEETEVEKTEEVEEPAKEVPAPIEVEAEKAKEEAPLPPFVKFGTIAISYLTIMSTLIVLSAVAIGIVFYAWYRINMWRKRMRAETKEVSQSVMSAFKALRQEVEEQIELLDGKPGLNKDERRVRDKLKEALSVSEEFIDKEIKDIEKSLE